MVYMSKTRKAVSIMSSGSNNVAEHLLSRCDHKTKLMLTFDVWLALFFFIFGYLRTDMSSNINMASVKVTRVTIKWWCCSLNFKPTGQKTKSKVWCFSFSIFFDAAPRLMVKLPHDEFPFVWTHPTATWYFRLWRHTHKYLYTWSLYSKVWRVSQPLERQSQKHHTSQSGVGCGMGRLCT